MQDRGFGRHPATPSRVSEVLSRPRLRKYVDPDEAAQMISAIHLRAIVIHDMPIPRRSPDPKDDAILATAVAGDAELVVSGDKREAQRGRVRPRHQRCGDAPCPTVSVSSTASARSFRPRAPTTLSTVSKLGLRSPESAL